MIKNISENTCELTQCPVKNVLDKIGDKWSMLILLVLEEFETMRFNELGEKIPTISQKMLSVTLKGLEADGLVNRTLYQQIPPKVEYCLTERGRSLMPHLHNLVDWANDNMSDILTSRFAYSNKQVQQ